MPPSDPDLPLTELQQSLLHDTLLSLEHAKNRLRSLALVQRLGGQPKLVRLSGELQEVLQRCWHLLDGLDAQRKP